MKAEGRKDKGGKWAYSKQRMGHKLEKRKRCSVARERKRESRRNIELREEKETYRKEKETMGKKKA